MRGFYLRRQKEKMIIDNNTNAEGNTIMKRALLLIAIIALAGCKPSADKAVELAKKEIAADTRDPDSAKFRYVRFVKKEESKDGTIIGYVCGQINGKNAFGAYAGFTPFMLEIKMKSKALSAARLPTQYMESKFSQSLEGQPRIHIPAYVVQTSRPQISQGPICRCGHSVDTV